MLTCFRKNSGVTIAFIDIQRFTGNLTEFFFIKNVSALSSNDASDPNPRY